MSFLTTHDGTTLFYKDWGAGQPVVFVHALGMTSASWDYTTPYLLARGIRCITYDQRGHGRSDDPGRGYDLDSMADDLHCLLERLDLRAVTLVAHSMGGLQIARYYTRNGHSDRVSKLVFMGSPDCLRKAPDNLEGLEDDQVRQALENVAADYPKWLDENVAAFFLPEIYGISEGMMRWAKDMMLQTAVPLFVRLQKMVFATDLRSEIGQIGIPAMVMHGDKDASIPFYCGERIARTIPGCILKAYKGAPHGLMFSLRDRINEDLVDFIHAVLTGNPTA